jgi:mannose-6-phosphate isomerase-like protein (cupin superfamily)
MSLFFQSPPKIRTKISHLSTFQIEGERSSVSFSSPKLINTKSSIAFTVLPCLPGLNPADDSIMILAYHVHPSQSELFLIISGTALFTLNHTTLPTSLGEETIIPKREYHRFTNASTIEPMSLKA